MALLHPTALLDAYVEDSLPQNRHAAVREHLGRCPACRDLVAERRRDARRRERRAGADTGPTAVCQPPTALLGTRRRMVRRAVPVLGTVVTVLAFVAVVAAAWQVGGRDASVSSASPTEHFTSQGIELDSYDIAGLRRAGWACPDLRQLGLELSSSTGVREGDTATVTLAYVPQGEEGKDKGAATVVLSESRSLATAKGSAATSAVGPNAATGATEPLAAAEGTQRVRIDSASVDFVVESGLDRSQTDALLQRVRALSKDEAAEAQAGTAEGWDRLLRGFSRLWTVGG